MPWKNPTAEELIGMKPEELKAKLDGAASKADLEAITAAQTETKSTLQSIKDSLAALTTPKIETQVDPNADDPAAVRLLADPDKFVDGKLKTVADASQETAAMVQEMRARQAYGPAFAQFGADLVNYAKNFTAAQRAQSNFWDFAVRTVIGDKAVKGEIKGSYPSLLGPSSVAPRSTDGEGSPEQELGPEMSAWFKSRGVPLDKALKIRNLMHRDGEPISHANYFGPGKAN